jgi:hypothetical protein
VVTRDAVAPIPMGSLLLDAGSEINDFRLDDRAERERDCDTPELTNLGSSEEEE